MKIFDLDTVDGPVTDVGDLDDDGFCNNDGIDIIIEGFDPDGEPCSSCDVQIYIPGPPGPIGPAGPGVRDSKNGLIAGASFTGSPKKYSVVFATPFDDINYSITISGTDSRVYTYESKATTGFVISSNAAAAIAGEVSWATMVLGEA